MAKLLWLCEYATLNGGEQSLLASMPFVRSAGFEPAVIGPDQGPFAEELSTAGVRVLPFDFADSSGQRRPQSELREQLAALLLGEQPDLLAANSLSMSRLSGPVARQLGIASIGHLRDIVGLSRQATSDTNAHHRLLAVSHATRNFHRAQGIAAEKTHVLYNGVDLRFFRPRPRTGWLAKELGLPPESLLIGTVGQLVLRKRQDLLAQAAVHLRERLPQAHYLLIGERYSAKDEALRFEADLRARFAQEEFGDRVHFLGYRRDLPQLLPELTMLVHPARQEPLGRVLLEGAAAGVAIIASDVGGTREIFPPEAGAARLVPAADAAALAEAILELAGDDARRAELARSARRRAESAFDVRHRAAELVRHYREVVGAARENRGREPSQNLLERECGG